MNEKILLSCPFCGGEATEDAGWAFCLLCGVGYEGDDACTKWNRRAGSTSPRDSEPTLPEVCAACGFDHAPRARCCTGRQVVRFNHERTALASDGAREPGSGSLAEAQPTVSSVAHSVGVTNPEQPEPSPDAGSAPHAAPPSKESTNV